MHQKNEVPVNHMGIFTRIKNLFSGFIGNATDKIEAKNPQLLIKEAEQKIQKSRKEAQKQLVEIQTWAETVRIDMKEAEVKLADIKTKILSSNNTIYIKEGEEISNKQYKTSIIHKYYKYIIQTT